MNIGIRRIGIGVVVLMLILIGNLTYLQIIDANNLKANPNNKRAVLRDFNHARGFGFQNAFQNIKALLDLGMVALGMAQEHHRHFL